MEGFEESSELLVNALSMAYFELRIAYKALPLPIRLPRGGETEGLEPLQKAVQAGAERIEDLPVDPLAATTLFNASFHWLSATAATMCYRVAGQRVYLATAVWNLEQATNLTELATAILRQG